MWPPARRPSPGSPMEDRTVGRLIELADRLVGAGR
jgi:hypothetical protein